MKEAPGPSVSDEIADIFTNYNIDVSIDPGNGLGPEQKLTKVPNAIMRR